MGGQRDLHATGDTHYIPPPPTIYTTLAGYGIAERDGERRESGRRACLRIGTVCDTVRSGTCMRYDAGPDGVRAYGSGRRACYGSGRRATRCGPGWRANGRDGVRYGTERDLYAIRCGPGRRANGRDGVRYGAATIGACERCGLEPRASVTERALRALLDEFTASARPAATRTSTADYV